MENFGGKEDEQVFLPPGFRFHPTDEELITHYLSKKVLDSNFSATAIGEVDMNKIEPWDLPSEELLFYGIICYFSFVGLVFCVLTL